MEAFEKIFEMKPRRAVAVHACNPSTLGGRGRRISEFKDSLVYRVSSRTARTTQRNPVLKPGFLCVALAVLELTL